MLTIYLGRYLGYIYGNACLFADRLLDSVESRLLKWHENLVDLVLESFIFMAQWGWRHRWRHRGSLISRCNILLPAFEVLYSLTVWVVIIRHGPDAMLTFLTCSILLGTWLAYLICKKILSALLQLHNRACEYLTHDDEQAWMDRYSVQQMQAGFCLLETRDGIPRFPITSAKSRHALRAGGHS